MSKEEIEQFRLSLPIFQFKEEILKHVFTQTFVLVTGDTGSGKSTQLPQFLIDSPEMIEEIIQKRREYYEQQDKIELLDQSPDHHQQPPTHKGGKNQKIIDRRDHKTINLVVTQPRRMAAISMAKRLAFERNETLGQKIGYTIRFDDTTSDNTFLTYMTDGILVRKCLQDKDLTQYDVVILDEAHERSLFTDVLFALVKKAAENRKGSLKVIVTSATLNVTLFKNYFNECPWVKVHGKSFPVEVKFSESPVNAAKRIQECVTAALRMHLHEGPGDILVFLPGSEDCESARKVCYERLSEILSAGREVPNVMLYTLYGSQSSEDQSQVFQKADENTRKIIFCTNIAETSLTIDNIGFVVDCGHVKQKIYNPRTGMDSLIVTPISKTQGVQRMGRAGRTQQGKCYRLYTKQFYEQMPDHSTAEIMRVNLASVLLLLKTMGIDDVNKFEFMEQPQQECILQSLRQLYLLGAIDEDGKITQLGLEMSRYPLEPSYSKSLISSKIFGCEQEMTIIVALLSTENAWQRITRVDQEGYQKLQEMQEKMADMNGDHFTLYQIFKQWQSAQEKDTFAKEHLLHQRALKQADNISKQLMDLVESSSRKRFSQYIQYYENDHIYNVFRKYQQRDKKKDNKSNTLLKSDLIKMALCTGFYFNTARKMHNSEDSYLMIYPEGTIVDIDQTSVYSLVNNYPETVIFTELGGTSLVRGVMKLVTAIDIEWVRPLFPNMMKVDLFRLAKIKFEQQNREKIQAKKMKKDEELKKKKEEEEIQKQDKIRTYMENYMSRKKIKVTQQQKPE